MGRILGVGAGDYKSSNFIIKLFLNLEFFGNWANFSILGSSKASSIFKDKVILQFFGVTYNAFFENAQKGYL